MICTSWIAVTTKTWSKPIVSGEEPAPREGHSATLIGKQIFVFGGCGKSESELKELYYRDLFILDTENLVWKRVITSGLPPSARDSHTGSSWDNKIIVIGGEDSAGFYLSDVHILDTESLTWWEVKASGQALTPRAGHATVALGKYMFVFGGFADVQCLYDDLFVLNIESGVWRRMEVEGEGPCPRFSAAGECLDLKKGTLVVMGGCTVSLDALGDMYYLHISSDLPDENEAVNSKAYSVKELKRKHHEQALSSLCAPPKCINHHDTAAINDHSLPLQISGQAGISMLQESDNISSVQKAFQATVTSVFYHGYTIKTNINGVPFRGIIFSSLSDCVPAAPVSIGRKAGQACDKAKSNDAYTVVSASHESSIGTIAPDLNYSAPLHVSQQEILEPASLEISYQESTVLRSCSTRNHYDSTTGDSSATTDTHSSLQGQGLLIERGQG